MEKQAAPDNYMVWAILCTILCCTPLGIVSPPFWQYDVINIVSRLEQR